MDGPDQRKREVILKVQIFWEGGSLSRGISVEDFGLSLKGDRRTLALEKQR